MSSKIAFTSVASLSRAVEQSPTSIVITNRSGDIEYVNPRFEEVTGYTSAEVLGTNPRLLKSGITTAETYSDLWKVISEGGEWRGQLCNRRKNGELFWEYAAISGLREENGDVTHFVAVKEDITERRIAGERLRESEERYRSLIAAMSEGVVLQDASGAIIACNQSAERIQGRTAEQMIGRDSADAMWDAIHEDGTPFPADEQPAMVTLRTGVPQSDVTMGIRQPDGTLKWISINSQPLVRPSESDPYAVVASFRDISERKRLEEVHLQALKLQALGTLSAGIAHDFNNILTAIRGNTDLAADDVGPNHPAAESLVEIRKATMRAAELVRRIMALGRPRAFEKEVVVLHEVIDEVLKLLGPTLPSGIRLATEFSEGTPPVLADAGQIHEAIVNLTTNAVYAIGSRGGTITYLLDVAHVAEQHGHRIDGLQPGRYARLTVTDTGCGMAPETLGRIFDTFYTTKPVGEGTGLGLSMVHGTMRSHGGAVTVESVLGRSSSFSLYFPADDQGVGRAEVQPVPTHRPRVSQRVLHVDDEPALVFLANRVLARMGHSVRGFTNPNEALTTFLAAPHDFDIVITDLSMPEMSGLELARDVLSARPDIPVLMTTGHIRDEDRGRALATGIRELIVKPVTADELARQFEGIFGVSR